VAQEFCRADSSVGVALNGATIGCTPVSSFGTDEQKEQWLTPVTRGEITTAIALTEPDTGSALSEITTTAETDGDEYVIDGEKTGSPTARVPTGPRPSVERIRLPRSHTKD